MEGDLNLLQTIIIAIVEGLTEFLPVSSTGHMIIAQNVLGVESTEFVKAFTFIIQFGAILSVVCLYWKRFSRLNHTPAPEGASALKRFLHKYDFYWKLLVAFIPAAVLGLLFSDLIDAMLESVIVVAVMLIVGGVAVAGPRGGARFVRGRAFVLFHGVLFHPAHARALFAARAGAGGAVCAVHAPPRLYPAGGRAGGHHAV